VTLRPGAASPIRICYAGEDVEIQPGASWESPLQHGRTRHRRLTPRGPAQDDFGPADM